MRAPVTVDEMALTSGKTLTSAQTRTIALVGIDGSGKTTQAHRLADELAAAGVHAAYRRNAGGRHWFGKLAVRLGRQDGDDLLGRRGMLFAEFCLRWLAILRTLLRRAVTGEVAVMDRYAVCQYASLRARGARPSAERRARLAYRLFPAPDMTIFLDVRPELAHARIKSRGYDSETMDYLLAAGAAYRSLPEFPDFLVVDANGSADEVAARIRAVVPALAAQRSRALVRTMILAGGPIAALAAAVGYQLADAL